MQKVSHYDALTQKFKRRENNGITFEDALKQKSIIKMDIVTLQNGRFVDITEVYNLRKE